MARPLRLELEGGLYHVTSRGNARNEIYLDDEDRLSWLKLFNDVCSRFNWICHVYDPGDVLAEEEKLFVRKGKKGYQPKRSK